MAGLCMNAIKLLINKCSYAHSHTVWSRDKKLCARGRISNFAHFINLMEFAKAEQQLYLLNFFCFHPGAAVAAVY